MNILQDERLTYFISSRSNYAETKAEVKARAFVPGKASPNELSVYRTSSLTENEIWEIGKQYVEGSIKIKARADFSARMFTENQIFLEHNIKFVSAPHPHPLHANILPIPTDMAERDKVFRELAMFSTLVMRPDNI